MPPKKGRGTRRAGLVVVTRSRPAGQGRRFGMVVLGSTGVLRVTLVTPAGTRGTG